VTILVVVLAEDPERVSEALRAGLGLGLRGDRVDVILVGGAAAWLGSEADPRIARALGTLERLGRPARAATMQEAAALAREARAVEVWTSPGQPRRLELDGIATPVDSRTLVEQIFEADAVVLW
jgi:hypothetical protein